MDPLPTRHSPIDAALTALMDAVHTTPLPSRPPLNHQRSFEDLGRALPEVTFCVFDLETTGGNPATESITEVGAVKVRGGRVEGTFQTLVNPGCRIPPFISVLTGITEAMVAPAPRIDAVLPTFMEFVGNSVLVGHNVRFDLSFLNAALEVTGRERWQGPSVDTVALARRLVRDETPNCKLETLADRLRLPHRPSHRALDDAWATTDLLHVLLERAGCLGVTGLDDLLSLPTMGGHAQADKLRLTDRLPRCPGVYLFRDRGGRVLYVGKATNLRQRVRSYFSTEERRKVGALLRETERIDHRRCHSVLEAEVLEIRLIHALEPHYNRVSTRWRSRVYVRLTDEAFPRLSVVRTPPPGPHLGPLSRKQAELVVEAVHTAIPLRRCSTRIPRSVAVHGDSPRTVAVHGDGPCTAAQLGVAVCPCVGGCPEADYRRLVLLVERALRGDVGVVVDPLHRRMDELAAAERFEEAAATRDRLGAFTSAVSQRRRSDQLRRTERLVLTDRHGARVELRRGRLVRVWHPDREQSREVEAAPADPGPPESGPLPADLDDEFRCTARWLDRNANSLRIEAVEGQLSSALPAVTVVAPRKRT